MRALVLRFDAPLVSFGSPAVDQRGVVQAYPALSMLTGLLANALGWDRRDDVRTNALQQRVRYAARTDRRGLALQDYQTVDLGSPWMLPESAGWTTRGRIAERAGSKDNATGTHIRYRDYRADSVHTVALTVTGDQLPTLDDLREAVRSPARPLFIGRKCCLPAAPLLVDLVEGESLLGILATLPRVPRADDGPLPAYWWEGEDASAASGPSRVVATTDERDWATRVHGGRRLMREGLVNPPEVPRG